MTLSRQPVTIELDVVTAAVLLGFLMRWDHQPHLSSGHPEYSEAWHIHEAAEATRRAVRAWGTEQ